MSVALLSLLALVAAIVASCFAPINVGLLSIALAFLIGHYMGGLTVAQVVAGFPAGMFLTLVGTTLLFALAQTNGTLEKAARYAVRLARGNRGAIPIVFFCLAVLLGATGAGGIAAAALLAPIAMSAAVEARISPFLMTLMLANGSNAGTFSPLAPTGIIANGLMSGIGLAGMEWPNFFNTLAAQSFVAFGGYLLCGGAKLFGGGAAHLSNDGPIEPFSGRQRLTLGVIGALILSVVIFRVDVGMGAFAGAVILSLSRAADEERALKALPLGVILMVSGVTVLIEVAAKTGGMDLFSGLLAQIATPAYAAGAMGLVTGIVSVYSSSSGVVMPAFLPVVPGLVAKLGGGNALMIAYSVNVGAHLVDVSPLSTIGALCLASVPPAEDRARLFRKLMLWGWSMALVGAIVCQVFFGYR